VTQLSDNKYVATVDNAFARLFFTTSSLNAEAYRDLPSNKLYPLCQDIESLDRHTCLSKLRALAQYRECCNLLGHALERYIKDDEEGLRLKGDGSALRIGQDGPCILRLCVGPDDERDNIQVGNPGMMQAGGSKGIKLLRTWIRRCDKCHSCVNEALPDGELWS